jgi:lipoprotein-anchoring transpeptidase ErfK/SrfK
VVSALTFAQLLRKMGEMIRAAHFAQPQQRPSYVCSHMFAPMKRWMMIAALGAALGACAPDPAMIEAGLMEAPQPKLVAGVYGPSQDGEFPLAAVPVEKVPAQYQRASVFFPTDEATGTIIINPADKYLYLVTGKNQAMRYGIAVGKAGFEWAGTAQITGRKNWPTWTPPPEMIERKPELSKWEKGQPGGPDNPLGARALYLTTNGVDYGYRIHGTPEWFSIGRNASSGCIRMINQDVIDLHDRVADNAKVVVLNADGSYPTKLKLPPPAPKPAKVVVTAGPSPAEGEDMTLNPALLGSAPAQPIACAVALLKGACPLPTLQVLPQPTFAP